MEESKLIPDRRLSTNPGQPPVIQPYIFNWRGQIAKTLKTERKLLDIFESVTVINSDDSHSLSRWLNVGEEAYFAKQFTTAVNNFKGDILFHIQGDATYGDWPKIVTNAEYYFAKYNYGIYAPNVSYSYHTADRVNVQGIHFTEKSLSVVTNPDMTCWFIHKDVIDKCTELAIDLESDNKFGWGIDWVMCLLSYRLGRPVIRDYEFNVRHPKGTGYDVEEAFTGLKNLVRSLDLPLQNTFRELFYNKETLPIYFKEKLELDPLNE